MAFIAFDVPIAVSGCHDYGQNDTRQLIADFIVAGPAGQRSRKQCQGFVGALITTALAANEDRRIQSDIHPES
jgi:hypothetical protein